MTTCSSILALGMMPLCLLIYTSVWTSSDTIMIPYDSIGKERSHTTRMSVKPSDTGGIWIQMTSCALETFWMICSTGITLAALIVPITVGMYVKRRWPNAAKKILKVGML